MAKKGEEFACQHCGKIVARNSVQQKYCCECRSEIDKLRKRERRKQETGKEVLAFGSDMTCEMCGKTIKRRNSTQKFCAECSNKAHKLRSSAYGREKRKREKEAKQQQLVEQRKEETLYEEPQEKRPYTLSEIAAAARKNNMTYGNYVFAWESGMVEPPERLQKKKRGRKKKNESG